MQNAYNHPQEQMARLEEAGLNPNLIYGTSASGATGQAEKIAPAKAAPFKMDIKNPMNNLLMHADIKQRNAQIDNLQVQNKVFTQEAILESRQCGA